MKKGAAMKIINGYLKIINGVKTLEYDLLFGKKFIHKKFSFRFGFYILIEKGGTLEIGNGCFFNNGCSITSMKKVTIGENSLFGENVKIYDHNYHINQGGVAIKNSGHSLGEVKIGNNCWIGSNVVILKGADIGDNSVIGAGCIIDSKIKANSLVKRKENYDVTTRVIKSSKV